MAVESIELTENEILEKTEERALAETRSKKGKGEEVRDLRHEHTPKRGGLRPLQDRNQGSSRRVETVTAEECCP